MTYVNEMSLDPVARIRRFNRAVTTEVGALDTSFLGRGRPLGAARVLNAIPTVGGDVAAIREYLALDKGQLSRLIKGLEDEGLLVTDTDPEDGRRRIARLTPAGRAEVAAYDDLSDSRAERLLADHPGADRLLQAMDLIASALGRDRIVIQRVDPRCADARHCLSEYYGELARRFSQGFDVSLSRDPDAAAMVSPTGAFVMAMSDGMPVGCVGLKGPGPVAEIKRLWVAPSARGLGLSHRLMMSAETWARELGIHTLRLDTNSALREALALYRNTGWTEIERFNDDPYPDVFFEKTL